MFNFKINGALIKSGHFIASPRIAPPMLFCEAGEYTVYKDENKIKNKQPIGMGKRCDSEGLHLFTFIYNRGPSLQIYKYDVQRMCHSKNAYCVPVFQLTLSLSS